MKKFSIRCLIPAIIIASTASFAVSPSKMVLPDEFKVYYSDKVGLSTKPFPGGTEKTIPTNNDYSEGLGCYISCYSKNAADGVYPVGEKVYMTGQVRVEGNYVNGYCVPKGYGGKDIRKSTDFRELCEASFPEKCPDNSCWADNQTSQWFL